MSSLVILPCQRLSEPNRDIGTEVHRCVKRNALKVYMAFILLYIINLNLFFAIFSWLVNLMPSKLNFRFLVFFFQWNFYLLYICCFGKRKKTNENGNYKIVNSACFSLFLSLSNFINSFNFLFFRYFRSSIRCIEWMNIVWLISWYPCWRCTQTSKQLTGRTSMHTYTHAAALWLPYHIFIPYTHHQRTRGIFILSKRSQGLVGRSFRDPTMSYYFWSQLDSESI